MILNTESRTVCDHFKVFKTEQDDLGIRTFQISTGEYLQIDIPGEILSHSISDIRRHVLINRLANFGFNISPIQGSLEVFFHMLMWPQDSNCILGKSPKPEQLPDDAQVEVVASNNPAKLHTEVHPHEH